MDNCHCPMIALITIKSRHLCVIVLQSFNATKLFVDGISLDIGEFAQLTESDTTKNLTEDEVDVIYQKRRQVYRRVDSWMEFLDIYGVQCNQFFVRCQIDWESFDCCDYFRPLYSMEEGVCFRYIDRKSNKNNDNMNIIQDEPGINGSLQILLKTPTMSAYWSGGPKWNGLTVGLPYLWDPFVTSAGKFVLVQLRGQKNVRDPTNIVCRPPTNWVQRDAGCSQTQWNNAVRTMCNCSLYSMVNRTLCDPFSFTLCLRDLGLELRIEYERLVKDNCKAPLCEEWQYQVSLSYAEINRAWVKSTIGEAETNSEYTLLNIYFPSLVFDEIRELRQVTFENIISQVGGLMGLWIGASMISVIQLGVYGCQYLFDKFMDWVQVKENDSEF